MRAPGAGRPERIHPALVLAIGYGVFCAVGLLPFVSGHPAAWAPSAALQAIRILSAVAIFIVASYLFRWVPPLAIIGVVLVGGFLAAGLALLAFMRIGPLELLAGLLAHSGGTDQLLAEEVDRASGGFATANYLGFFAAQYTLLGIGVWPLVARRYQPLLAVVIATLVAALVVSYSRSAYVGTAAGIVVLVALRSPRQALLLVAIAAVAGVALYPLFLEARVNGAALDPTVIFQRAQSENWRSLAAAAGISMFLAQPVFGVGFGVFQHLSPAYIGGSPATASHDAYVQIIAEQGLVGVIMVAGIVIALATALWRSRGPFRGTALAMSAAYLIQSFFINSTQSIQITGATWIVMAAALFASGRASTAGSRGT